MRIHSKDNLKVWPILGRIVKYRKLDHKKCNKNNNSINTNTKYVSHNFPHTNVQTKIPAKDNLKI